MELGDILAWKSASTAILSTDGRWFAYRASPLDGDSEVVIRQTQGDKEYRFPVGEGRTGMLALSEDVKWAAFSVAPTKKEAAQLRKQRKPIQNKVTILNLADGTETKVDKIQRFAFSGENAGVDRAEEVRRGGARRQRGPVRTAPGRRRAERRGGRTAEGDRPDPP